jgi:hypothetical protein
VAGFESFGWVLLTILLKAGPKKDRRGAGGVENKRFVAFRLLLRIRAMSSSVGSSSSPLI